MDDDVKMVTTLQCKVRMASDCVGTETRRARRGPAEGAGMAEHREHVHRCRGAELGLASNAREAAEPVWWNEPPCERMMSRRLMRLLNSLIEVRPS